MERRPLGGSGIEVSALALGSWRTYERIPRDQGVAVMRAARETGISFLDDARYNDETGSAPLATGYSEVVFGELFRGVGWARDEVVVSNKLWWEFWPEQSAAEELDGSLGRMGFDYVDLIYAESPPAGFGVEEVVAQVTGLIDAGKARAWGVLNWEPGVLVEAARVAAAGGRSPPCTAQLPYSLAHTDAVEDDAMAHALDAAGASVVASYALAGGALTGKYTQGRHDGRLAGQAETPTMLKALALGEQLAVHAGQLDTTPSRLAIAFALANERVATVLFGATTPEQIAENVAALELLDRLDDADLASLRALAVRGG